MINCCGSCAIIPRFSRESHRSKRSHQADRLRAGDIRRADHRPLRPFPHRSNPGSSSAHGHGVRSLPLRPAWRRCLLRAGSCRRKPRRSAGSHRSALHPASAISITASRFKTPICVAVIPLPMPHAICPRDRSQASKDPRQIRRRAGPSREGHRAVVPPLNVAKRFVAAGKRFVEDFSV